MRRFGANHHGTSGHGLVATVNSPDVLSGRNVRHCCRRFGMSSVRWLPLAVGVWVAQFAVLLALPPRSTLGFIVDCLGWITVGVVLLVQAERRARREPDAAGGWRLMALAGFATAATSILDVVLRLVYGRLPLPPWLTAAMDDSSWLLMVAGLMAWTRRIERRGAALRAGLDAFLFATSFFLLAWWARDAWMAVSPDASASRLIRAALPLGLAATGLGVVAYLGAKSAERLKGPLGWLGLGYLGLLVGALGYAWATIRGIFYTGHPLDAFFQLPLAAFAAAPSSRHPVPAQIEGDDYGSGLGDFLTVAPAVTALTVAAVRYLARVPADAVSNVGEAALVAVLIAREVIAVRDVRNLSRTLESRVADRTRRLEESQRALIQAQRMEAVARLAGGVAHDFNNVLTVIAGHSELLKGGLDEVHQAQSIAAVQQAARSGTELARRLLSFARPMPACPRHVRASEALARASQCARGLSRGRVAIEATCAQPDATVVIDPVQLDQVLTNLAANAIDAMGGNGILRLHADTLRLSRSTEGVAQPPGNYVRFTVADTGLGMDPSTLARVFEPFFTTKAEDHGTGLGLSTAYAIVTQAGGTIRVESRPGEGTRFDVLLPEADQAPVSERTTLVRASGLQNEPVR